MSPNQHKQSDQPIGWAWALILAELVPDSADKLLDRGLEYGNSRAVCNVHWQSDVVHGQTVATMVIAQLHGNAEFRADLAAARSEIAALQAAGKVADLDCAAEAAALER